MHASFIELSQISELHFGFECCPDRLLRLMRTVSRTNLVFGENSRKWTGFVALDASVNTSSSEFIRRKKTQVYDRNQIWPHVDQQSLRSLSMCSCKRFVIGVHSEAPSLKPLPRDLSFAVERTNNNVTFKRATTHLLQTHHANQQETFTSRHRKSVNACLVGTRIAERSFSEKLPFDK